MDKIILKQSVEWDTVNWAKALKFWFDKVSLENKNYKCLELGSRRGGLSLWLSALGNDVICSDFKDPSESASQVHKRFSVKGKINYETIDATSIPYKDHFDIIAFKSILGGISGNGNDHLSKVVAAETYKALKPGGKLFFAENMAASKMHHLTRKIFAPWGSYWNYFRIEDLNRTFSNFSKVEYKTAGFLGAFGRTEIQRNILGNLDTLIFDRILSDNLKYVGFGVATK